jgi:molecular chaperone DnaJ
VASQTWIDKDFYEILGVPKTASTDEIKKTYRKLALEHHPDRNPGKENEDRFKEIGEAYSVLSNTSKRAEYDKLRDAIRSGYAGAGFPGGYGQGFRATDFGVGEEFDVDELLRQIFGDRFSGVSGFGPFGFGRAQTRAQRGRDVETEIELTFDEAVQGVERKVRMDLPSGRRDVTVRIPAGVADGARIRARSQGEHGSEGGGAGDLYVRVKVAPHKLFGRRANDLTLKLPISFSEAALGAEVKVPTLEGPVKLKIPAGTSSGRTFRLRGRGIKRSDGTAGDLLATVHVVVPKKLSRTQKELVEQLAEGEESPRTDLEVDG